MGISGYSHSASDTMPVQMIRIRSPRLSFAFTCTQLREACVCNVPGCLSSAEHWNVVPAWMVKTSVYNLLALKMQLIRCCIYIEATNWDLFFFFLGIDAGHWSVILDYSPSFCLCTVPRNLCGEHTRLVNPLSTSELLVVVVVQLVRLRNGCLMLPYNKCGSAACFLSLTVLQTELLFMCFLVEMR